MFTKNRVYRHEYNADCWQVTLDYKNEVVYVACSDMRIPFHLSHIPEEIKKIVYSDRHYVHLNPTGDKED